MSVPDVSVSFRTTAPESAWIVPKNPVAASNSATPCLRISQLHYTINLISKAELGWCASSWENLERKVIKARTFAGLLHLQAVLRHPHPQVICSVIDGPFPLFAMNRKFDAHVLETRSTLRRGGFRASIGMILSREAPVPS